MLSAEETKMQFCLANGNEEEFISIAIRLGLKELCFVYADAGKVKGINAKGIKLFKALMCKGKQIDKKRHGIDFVVAEHSENDRNLIEGKRIDIIYGLESSKEQDQIHYRNSGMNQVIAGICAKKGIKVLFDFNLVLRAHGKRRAVALGRMMQNMMLCRKFKVNYIMGNVVKEPYGLRSSRALESFETLLK